MYEPLKTKTRCLMLNSWCRYKISEKIEPGYMYYLVIPGYISDDDVRKIICRSWGSEAVWMLVEYMNKAEGHTGLKWKGNPRDQKKYRGPPMYALGDEHDGRSNVY